MDGSVVLSLVVGVLAGLVVGGVPLLRAVRGHRGLQRALGRSPGPAAVPDPDELSPNQLAFLAGGPVRVGETVVVDAFLGERIRRQTARGFFTLVGPSKPYAHEKDPSRRVLVKAFKKRVGVSAREMVRRVVTGRGVDQLRRELVEARLIVDSPEIRAVLEARAGLPRTIRGWRILSLLVAAAGAGVLFLVEPVGAAVGALAGGLTASALLVVAQAVLGATGGPSVLPNTAAGNEVVERARERHGAGSAAGMTRDQAVLHTAVTGFRALRDGARAKRSRRSVSAEESPVLSPDLTAANAGAGGQGDAVGGEGLVDLDALCEFADLCQGGSPDDSSGSGSGGGAGGDGWNGGFSDSGGSGSGGGWGGWGGGGDSGGDSGGGGGDGGGGGGD